MADLGTPAAGTMTPNPAAPSAGKQPLVYICGGESILNSAASMYRSRPAYVQVRNIVSTAEIKLAVYNLFRVSQ